MKNNFAILIQLLLSLLFGGCSASQGSRTATEMTPRSGDTTVIEISQPLTLADFLVRVPGVLAEGNQVSIRGAGPPLFIIDGTRIGHSYEAAASAVDVNDIESVEVLKSPSELAIYGMEGQNGVIIIRTKRQ